ncbi:MAG: hypothetical protein AAF483_15730, partial [Planctomycetota bacterium]
MNNPVLLGYERPRCVARGRLQPPSEPSSQRPLRFKTSSQTAIKVGLAVFVLLVSHQASSTCFAQQETNASIIELKGGIEFAAKLSSVQQDVVTVTTDAGVKELATEQISRIAFNDTKIVEAAILILLKDGGSLKCDRISSDGELLSVAQAESSFSLNTKVVEAILLPGLNAEQLSGWENYAKEEVTSDALIVKKPGGNELTRIDGIVLAISSSDVRFDFGGQEVPVPIARIAGIRFFTSQESEASLALGVLQDRFGSNMNVTSMSATGLEAGRIKAELACGATIRFPEADLVAFTISSDAGVYLADLKPNKIEGRASF